MRSLFHSRVIIIIVVTFAVLIVATSLPFFISSNLSVRITQTNVSVFYPCGDNCVQFDGDWLGFSIPVQASTFSVAPGSVFSLTITPRNTDPLSSHSVSNITSFTQGFEIVSISPNLPVNINSNANVSLTMEVRAPVKSYSGPLYFNLTTL